MSAETVDAPKQATSAKRTELFIRIRYISFGDNITTLNGIAAFIMCCAVLYFCTLTLSTSTEYDEVSGDLHAYLEELKLL